MTKLPALSLFAALSLAACAGTEARFDAPTPTAAPSESVSVRFARIEVVAVTLPTYGQDEEIHIREASGAIVPLGPLWADEPARAVTLQLARDLDTITGRLVAPEPWPFRDPSDVRVDLRVTDFHATEAGTFRLAGQVFVAPEDGGRDRARGFEIETPIGAEGGPAAIAAARAQAVTQLALFVAKNGLR
ncbi:PqiC family protein [Thetidibacter halocola]|uniref:Membrane integrity-associated transporter subunit PqiC n=1 Tax=Thetidibacter halocola TaxID=2827239 RepID=A0A8J8B7D1_9RHOB|nr:ABC-type transport auxiliary lipoprotein family protein [Thetidibacter halocola]MBS0124981.1 membrane integrity-associated transporter subunit PqiC [Thetidibacter halocola]